MHHTLPHYLLFCVSNCAYCLYMTFSLLDSLWQLIVDMIVVSRDYSSNESIRINYVYVDCKWVGELCLPYNSVFLLIIMDDTGHAPSRVMGVCGALRGILD